MVTDLAQLDTQDSLFLIPPAPFVSSLLILEAARMAAARQPAPAALAVIHAVAEGRHLTLH